MTSVENTTASTKNIKDNRKVVVATYAPPVFVFKLPDGIDLADENVVEGWDVKYAILTIYYVDGHKEKIEPYCSEKSRFVQKRPQEAEIEPAEEYCVEYSEDEEEEEED